MYQMICMLTLGYQAFNSMTGYYLKIVLFEATLVKWGNSVGLALPKPIRDGMNLNPGDKITIVVDNDKI